MRYVRSSYLVLLWLTLLAVIVQFFLAGAAIFDAVSFDAHEGLGFVLHIPVAAILLVLALIGVRPVGTLLLAVVFSVLLFLQPFWVDPIGDESGWLAALHVLIPAFILGIGFAISQRFRPVVGWGTRAGPVIAPPR